MDLDYDSGEDPQREGYWGVGLNGGACTLGRMLGGWTLVGGVPAGRPWEGYFLGEGEENLPERW